LDARVNNKAAVSRHRTFSSFANNPPPTPNRDPPSALQLQGLFGIAIVVLSSGM